MEKYPNIGQHIVNHFLEDKKDVDDLVLEEWLAKDEENQEAFRQYKKIWETTGNIPKMNQFDAQFAWRKVNEVHQSRLQVSRRVKNALYVISGMAAAFLVVFLFSLNNQSQNMSSHVGSVEMKTEYGNRSEILLPDGSRIRLNAGSHVSYKLNETEKIREVGFQGEGFFEVAKDEMPFRVTTPDGFRIKVLGTTFNLSAYEDDSTVLTTLIEGSVELENGEKATVLTSGQMAAYDKSTREIEFREGNLSHTYGWLSNKLYMENMSLAEVCKHMERWYDVEITFTGDIGKKIYYSGVLKEDTIYDVLDALCLLSKIKYRIKGKKINISSIK